jgi:phage gp36-like protein
MAIDITEADLKARLGEPIVRAIYDEDNDGAADQDAIARLLADASSKVEAVLAELYPTVLATVPNEVKRLKLDVAVAMAAQRHPEHVRREWVPLMEYADRELTKLRTGKVGLGFDKPVTPAGNQRAWLGPSTRDPEAPPRKFDDMGDF